MIKILITGITGFLGSNIAEKLLTTKSVTIAALKRSTSDLWRCDSFKEKIDWIDSDEKEWKEEILMFGPNIIIHCAWSGVVADDRLDWKSQMGNLDLLLDLLEIARQVKCSRFIGLGSQAEYGTFSGKISEAEIPKPNTAYGAVKLMSCNLLESFCNENDIDWFWLRLFPLFGPKEAPNWLLPSLIKNIHNGTVMDLTAGEQRYAYLYVDDFSDIICNIAFSSKSALSGVYNISSTSTISLRALLEKIRDKIDPEVKLNFGALPYRHYQTMHMEGDMTKYKNAFGELNNSNFDENITRTIKYYLLKNRKSGN